MSELDVSIKAIKASVESTNTAILEILNTSDDYPELINQLLNDISLVGGKKEIEGVSLLSLKNECMLSYLNNLVLIILSSIEKVKPQTSKSKNSKEDVKNIRANAIKNSIIQRVSIERGIKSLEKRLGYQLDKMIRSYTRMESEVKDKVDQKGENEEENSGSEESDSDDELSYKPDAQSLVKPGKYGKDKRTERSSRDRNDAGEKVEKYKPPKIAATAPPKQFAETNNTSKHKRKLQSMEEYLIETGDKPILETSIGSNIQGRGGTKTLKEMAREKRVATYEETNFTRLSNAMTKKTKAQKEKDGANFFGEDWSMFSSGRDTQESFKKTKKNAWEKAKKRRVD